MSANTTSLPTPKYRALYQWLVDRIYDGTYQFQEKLPSEASLCTTFDISRQTVRNALHDLEADGYITRSRGSGSFVNKMVRNKEKLIGVLFTTLSEYINSDILTGMESVFSRNGYSIILEQSHNQLENETLFLKKMLNSKVAGLIVEGTKSSFPSPNTNLYEKLTELRIPYIFVNSRYSNVPATSVVWDDEKASYLVTEQLIKSGHTKIAGLFRFDETQGANRYLGYVKALMDNGIPVQEDYISWYGLSGRSGEQKRQLRNVNFFVDDVIASCTALICYNDYIACHVVPYLTSKGVSIPGDLTVVSFDNSDLMQLYGAQRVPSVTHPKEKLGEMAANILLQYIHVPALSQQAPSEVVFPVSREQELDFENILYAQVGAE